MFEYVWWMGSRVLGGGGGGGEKGEHGTRRIGLDECCFKVQICAINACCNYHIDLPVISAAGAETTLASSVLVRAEVCGVFVQRCGRVWVCLA